MPRLADVSTGAVARRRLAELRHRLSRLTVPWTVQDYQSFLMFFVRLLPNVFEAERCTIFIIEPGTEKICSMYGTGIEGMRIEPPRKGSIVGEVITSGRGVVINDLDERSGYHVASGTTLDFTAHTMVCVPITNLTAHGVAGAVQVLNKTGEQGFDHADLELLQDVAQYLSIFIESILVNQEILQLSRRLNMEVSELDRYLVKQTLLIAESEAMREIVALAGEISSSPVNILLQGENGTGKEVVARLIHELSERRNSPFIAVNCSAIPEHLMESEFFGYEKGAFTGADKPTMGRFEAAEGGTLFLDEVAELPLNLQPKFLRALEEREGSRLGSAAVIPYNFRVISATNKNLKQEKDAGRFREDLFFRLFSIEMHMPPLRERPDDILPMATAFLDETNKLFKKSVAGFTPQVLAAFEGYDWPGNVRQLKREIERLVALTPNGKQIMMDSCSPELSAVAPGDKIPAGDGSAGTVEQTLPERVKKVEVDMLRTTLRRTGGNKSKAARLLGITRQGLLKKIKRYRLEQDNPG